MAHRINLNAWDVEKLVLRAGWQPLPGRPTSHRYYVHPNRTGQVEIPFHTRQRTFQMSELSIIFGKAGLQKELAELRSGTAFREVLKSARALKL